MYKNILFDIGNVLITVEYKRAFNKLSKYMNEQTIELVTMGQDGFVKEIRDDQVLFETGKITMPEFFMKIKGKFNLKMNVEQFEDVWCSMFSRKKDVLQFAEELSKKYKIFLLSNTNETHINHLIDALPVFNFISGAAFSHEIGYLKPESNYYYEAMRKLEIKAEESIFIDDLELNVNAANEAGITSLKFENLVKLKKDIEKIIL